MQYPVVLPSGCRVDRYNIYDYMWESPVDPFSGRHLTDDMLVSDRDLKERIERFIVIYAQQNMQSTTNETMQSGSATCKSSPGAQNDESDPNDVNPKYIPKEFLDELALTLMKDPVILPSDARMDRAIIQSHISEFHIDPFTGRYLTQDMLVSDDKLKARIEEFISTSRARSNAHDAYNRAINCLDIDDIPMEFRDSLESTLMRDPVVLPSGHRVDRAVILNRISKFPVDPFFGRHLTEDMLVSDDNLQAKIDEFISSLPGGISMQKTSTEATQTGTETYQSGTGTPSEKEQNNIANAMEGMSLEEKGPMPSRFADSRDN
ncbi:hypothetical protein MKW98_006213 [Papaver atlanticum]|uniref:U-box domain-containing protein n=1 Tax=Papaver atlanticum TaxID=357466 RepID=A0AAD4XXD5_9MAGN|nr:hypothetical protein MKW98_006213 [Papaver atlanticum]